MMKAAVSFPFVNTDTFSDIILSFIHYLRCYAGLQIFIGEISMYMMKSTREALIAQEKMIVTGECCYLNPLIRRIIRFIGEPRLFVVLFWWAPFEEWPWGREALVSPRAGKTRPSLLLCFFILSRSVRLGEVLQNDRMRHEEKVNTGAIIEHHSVSEHKKYPKNQC